ncbi:MAG: murein biosynthesis integral membrane protein MurJ [Candidatus Spechtbacterales bacterium]
MVSRLIHFRSKTITSAAFLLATTALLSRVLGLFRDGILAGKFGAGDELDIYFAAFRIPDLLYNIVIAGAISSAFIPVFIALYTKNKKEAWAATSNFLNIAVASLFILGILLVLTAPFLVKFVAPGFDEAKTAATVEATRIMFLSPLFLGMSAILGGILNSFKRFFVYALAPLFYNAGIIFGAVVLADDMGVLGLALGVVIGSFLHFIIQVPSVFLSGFYWQRVFDLGDKHFRKIFFLMVPRAFGLVVFQLNLWVITAIASVLSSGSIAIFNFANHLQFLPIGIIGYSFATAAMPSFAKSVSQERIKLFGDQLANTVRMVLFFVVPTSVLIFVLRAHIVRLIFGSGEFGWDDTRLTAAVLGIFTFGIFAHSLIPLLSKAFYAMQNTKTPVIINSIGFFINIALSAFFVFVLFGDPKVSGFISEFLDMGGIDNIALLGLPLAFSLAGIINFAILFYALKKSAGVFQDASLYFAGLKMFFASIAAGLTTYGTLFLVEPLFYTETVFGLLLQAGFASIAGVIAYIAIMLLFRSQELISIWRKIRRF